MEKEQKVNLKLEYPPGATPLNPDEINGLIPDIETQAELNALEQQNILNGKNWGSKFKGEILDEIFARKLHEKMYEDVWEWAGIYRTSEKIIGINSTQISAQVLMLMNNAKAWIEFQSYSWEEILARFHHQLVFIHPFPNGNGRYARLHTELLAEKYNQPTPTWGSNTYAGGLAIDGTIRTEYISALQDADNKKFQRLISFLKT